MSFGAAHAEQYCKSLDKDGNATYTLASDKGCKKMKTVAISHHITPNATPKPEAAKTTSTATAATAQTNTAQTSTAPANTGTATATAPAPAPTTPNANTPKPPQTPNE